MANIIKFPKPPRKLPTPEQNLAAKRESENELKRNASEFFRHCIECGVEMSESEALLCDGRIRKSYDFKGNPYFFSLCSAPICPNCATSKHGKDYCSFHANHTHEITDVPNSGKYKNWRARIKKHLQHSTVWDIEMVEESSQTTPKGLFFCKTIEIGY